MTEFELFKMYLDEKQDFNYSTVENITGFKTIILNNGKEFIFNTEGKWVE